MGLIEIWGQTVPNLLAMAGRSIKEVAESIPISGFMLADRAVFGLTAKAEESLETVIGESVSISFPLAISEGLESNLLESVGIVNA